MGCKTAWLLTNNWKPVTGSESPPLTLQNAKREKSVKGMKLKISRSEKIMALLKKDESVQTWL